MEAQGLHLDRKNNPLINYNCPISCYRPPLARGIPVELLEPIFGELIDSKTKIDRNDCDFTREVCRNMSMPYSKEDQRLQIFLDLLSTYLGQTVAAVRIGNGLSDGAITVRSVKINLMVLNVEGKAEIGQGKGDPTFQNIGYYLSCLLGTSISVVKKNILDTYKCPGSFSVGNVAYMYSLLIYLLLAYFHQRYCYHLLALTYRSTELASMKKQSSSHLRQCCRCLTLFIVRTI